MAAQRRSAVATNLGEEGARKERWEVEEVRRENACVNHRIRSGDCD